MSLITTRPQSIGEVLDAGFRLFREGFRTCLPVIIALGLIQGLTALGLLLIMPDDPDAGLPSLWLSIAVLLAIGVAGMLVWLMLLARLDSAAGGTTDGSINAALTRIPAAIIALVLYILAVTAGTLLLVLPGIYLYTTLALALPLLVIEGLGPVAALKRSSQLVKGYWWRTAVLTFLITVIFIVLSVIGEVLASLVSAVGGGTSSLTAVVILGVMLSGLVTGVGQTYLTAGYLAICYDLRVRHEGTDLESRIDSMAGA